MGRVRKLSNVLGGILITFDLWKYQLEVDSFKPLKTSPSNLIQPPINLHKTFI